MLQLRNKSGFKHTIPIETEGLKQGWDLFSDEVAWFIYDFFNHELDPIDKLTFFGYYVMGFTLEELGERLHCTHQNAAVKIDKMNKKIKRIWKNKEHWVVRNDS